MNVLCGMTLEEIQGLCREHGQPEFRAKQLCDWIYQKRATSFDDRCRFRNKLLGFQWPPTLA